MCNNANKYTVIFDGECSFCNDAVNFIIKRDPKALFVFTPLQGTHAAELMNKFNIPYKTDSLILIKDGEYYLRTDAALKIAIELSGPWPLFFLMKFIPREFRDPFYKIFSANRKKIFGEKKSCIIPPPETRDRFIE